MMKIIPPSRVGLGWIDGNSPVLLHDISSFQILITEIIKKPNVDCAIFNP